MIRAIEQSDLVTVHMIGDQGTTWAWTLTVKDSTGTPINLTGYSARGQIRSSFSASTIAATISCTISTPSSGGNIACVVAASTTSSLSACSRRVTETNYNQFNGNGVYQYDVEIYTGTPEVVERVQRGNIYVDPEVTKPEPEP
jgi:hypothetical protein